MLKKGLIILFILLISVSFIYRKNIFQEGNPLPILFGTIRLNFSNDKVVKITKDNSKYITKSRNGINSITLFMKEKGYTLTDQMWAGYIFEKENKSRIIITHRHYSKLYDIWYLPKK